MKKINKMGTSDIEEMKRDFERVMKLSYAIWQQANFRIPTVYTKGTINTAILETVCNYLSSKTDAFIEKNKRQINKNYAKLINHGMYLEAVTTSTGNKAKVLDRFKFAHEILNEGTTI